ncbi:MFS general substrate transporter [Lindgomyces ingoldianus]|uniref:MFS general substrate transporter n=1 Tax=Lindgomyces ingoldianus TaxID=673940 RepID=A0ACB6QVB2_9PLEO|nr:MFS general substrate transporter [Lindgomyces ingoldianus]KAF2470938.1 MFS general substrate transporter [Lindgomyces ingoldianus]
MVDVSNSTERDPLLQRPGSSSSHSSASKSLASVPDAERNGKDGAVDKISASRGALICCSIGLLIFLQATNISILTTTQSSIAADLDAFEKASWLTSSYLIAMSSLAPLMGRLSQLFSPRLCMFFSTLVICLGTIITSTSISFEMFMVGRAFTGAGAAGVLIVATIIVIQMASPKNRGIYIGLVNSGMTVGVSLGAIIAGALVPKIGWKPLFGIQAPLSLVAGFGLLVGIPPNYIATRGEYANLSLRGKLARLDYSGALLLVFTIILFLLGLSGPRILLIPLVLSAVLLPIFILNEIYIAKDPIIPIMVLKSRGTLLTCLATVGFMMARWTVLFYTPVYALAVRGWSPAAAGSILIPTNAGFASGGLLVGLFHIRRNGSFYLPSLISMTLFPATLLVLAFMSTAESAWGGYVAVVFCNGLLTGAALNYTLVHLLHLTLSEVHPIVLSLLATFRGFAGSFGSAIGGGLFARILNRSLVDGFADAGLKHRKDLIRRLVGSPALVSNLEGKEKEIAVKAYESGLKGLFLAGLGLAIIVAVVQAGTGWKDPAKTEAEVRIEEDEVEEEEGLIGGS